MRLSEQRQGKLSKPHHPSLCLVISGNLHENEASDRLLSSSVKFVVLCCSVTWSHQYQLQRQPDLYQQMLPTNAPPSVGEGKQRARSSLDPKEEATGRTRAAKCHTTITWLEPTRKTGRGGGGGGRGGG